MKISIFDLIIEPMIVYENELFLIAYKPHGLPTVPLKGQVADTLLSRVGELRPQVLEPYSDKYWEGGAVHRLDTDTAGLVIFAKDRGFYSEILDAQNRGLFSKTYTAVCSIAENADIDFNCPVNISSYFRAFGPGRKKVKPLTDSRNADSNILYTTCLEKAVFNGGEAEFTVSITRGFRHQIRSHLAWKGFPIKGDRLYNSIQNEGELQLECTAVEFPLNGKTFSFQSTALK